jgi:serine/threonine-protein phosphatase PP1 catalytic subunit
MFGPDVCEEFFRINGLEKVVRAHWALETGYKWWFDGKLLSLFSIPDYCGRKGMGAFALMEKGQIEIFVFGRSSNSSLSLIDPGN